MRIKNLSYFVGFIYFGFAVGSTVTAASDEECGFLSITDCNVHSSPQNIACGRNISWEGSDMKYGDNKHLFNVTRVDDKQDCNQLSISTELSLNYKRENDVSRWTFGVASVTKKNGSLYLIPSTGKQAAIHLPALVHGTIQTMAYVTHVIGFEFFRFDETVSKLSPDKASVHTVSITFTVTDDREIDSYARTGHQITRQSINLSCVQLNGVEWVESNCETLDWSELNITCQCKVEESALVGVKTSFKILAGSVNTMPTYFALTVISTLFLFVTFIVLVRFRRVYKDPNRRYIAQLNLTISLFLRHSFLLTGFGLAVFNPLDRYACEFVAVFHVYFLITTVLWVLVEGLIIYRKVCKSSLTLNLRVVAAITVAVWFLPLVLIVSLSAVEISRDRFIKNAESFTWITERVKSVSADADAMYQEMLNYRKFDYCWTSSTRVTIALYAVILLSLFINFVVLVWVGVVVWKIRSADATNTPEAMRTAPRVHTQTIDTFRAIVILTMVLNIPWLISLLAGLIDGIEKESSLIQSYIHFVCVFLQGPLLFYVYCVQKQELKSAIRRKIKSQNVRYSIGSRKSQHRVNSPNSNSKQ